MLGWTLVTLLALIGLLYAEHGDRSLLKWLFKPLASTGFLAVALAAGALDSRYGLGVLVALGLSWLGDVLLISPRKAPFLAGILSFLCGHMAYCVAFYGAGQSGTAAGGAALALLVPAVLVGRWLLPKVDADMQRPVVAYIGVITVMVALAVGTVVAGNSAWIAAGALAFYLSDISVAIDRFVRPAFVNRLWGLPLYYGAQLMLAWSVASM